MHGSDSWPLVFVLVVLQSNAGVTAVATTNVQGQRPKAEDQRPSRHDHFERVRGYLESHRQLPNNLTIHLHGCGAECFH